MPQGLRYGPSGTTYTQTRTVPSFMRAAQGQYVRSPSSLGVIALRSSRSLSGNFGMCGFTCQGDRALFMSGVMNEKGFSGEKPSFMPAILFRKDIPTIG